MLVIDPKFTNNLVVDKENSVDEEKLAAGDRSATFNHSHAVDSKTSFDHLVFHVLHRPRSAIH
jgi:hypothetical protein